MRSRQDPRSGEAPSVQLLHLVVGSFGPDSGLATEGSPLSDPGLTSPLIRWCQVYRVAGGPRRVVIYATDIHTGRDGAVGIATRYGLEGPGFKLR
jgi:hypothetical protein